MVTKREIEAELQATEKDAAIANLRRFRDEWMEFEATLKAEEKKVWQPHWSHNDPLPERLLRTGRSRETVKELEALLAAMPLIITSKPLPPEIQRGLDDAAAAETSALQQLAAVVAAEHKGG